MRSPFQPWGLVLTALLHTVIVRGLDSCRPQSVTCAAATASPSPNPKTCGSQGTVGRPKEAQPGCSYQSIEACRNLCLSLSNCLAFSFNASTGECNVYADLLENMDFAVNRSSSRGQFFEKTCFKYSCGVTGSALSSCPVPPVSTVTRTVSNTCSGIGTNPTNHGPTITTTSSCSRATTVTVSGSAFGSSETKTVTVSVFPSNSPSELKTTVTKTIVSTDIVENTVSSIKNSIQTVIDTTTVLETVTRNNSITDRLTNINTIFITATEILTDSIFVTNTATIDVTDIVTTTASASTPSVSACPVPQAIDINGCPAINGYNDGNGFIYSCGYNYGPGSIAQGTTSGVNIEDCASQCFLNFLGQDCLGATFSGGSYNNLGVAVPGTCTLYNFPDGRVSAPGYAAATFQGF